MRLALVFVLALFALPALGYGNDFCDGYADGYEEGWCHEQGVGCIAPITPICPIPKIGEEGFRGGYNRGFIEGVRARSKRDRGRF